MLNKRTIKWTTIDTYFALANCLALGILATPFVVVHEYNKIYYGFDNVKG